MIYLAMLWYPHPTDLIGTYRKSDPGHDISFYLVAPANTWDFCGIGGHKTVFYSGRFRGLLGRALLRSRLVSFSTVARNALASEVSR